MPPLELVGWFTLCAASGPTPALLPIHRQITSYNESALLLSFHPAAVTLADVANTRGRLPFTVYESILELGANRGDGSMQVDGEEFSLQFRPLPYTIETDETEMIAIDYVAKGAGSAAALTPDTPILSGPQDRPDKKGKKRADSPEMETAMNGPKVSTNPLSSEEEDQIAGMTTRLNSVRMLQSRLSFMSSFIRSQTPSYLTGSSVPMDTRSPEPAHLPHLRNIQALLTRLSLLSPASDWTAEDPAPTDAFIKASRSQSNDVGLSSLLALVGQNVQGMSEMARKFATVESARFHKSKAKGGFGPGGFEGLGEDDGILI